MNSAGSSSSLILGEQGTGFLLQSLGWAVSAGSLRDSCVRQFLAGPKASGALLALPDSLLQLRRQAPFLPQKFGCLTQLLADALDTHDVADSLVESRFDVVQMGGGFKFVRYRQSFPSGITQHVGALRFDFLVPFPIEVFAAISDRPCAPRTQQVGVLFEMNSLILGQFKKILEANLYEPSPPPQHSSAARSPHSTTCYTHSASQCQ